MTCAEVVAPRRTAYDSKDETVRKANGKKKVRMDWLGEFEDERPTAYKTVRDVVDYEVTPALGEFADCYDALGIARDCWRYDDGLGGYVKAVDEDGFWESAIAHDVTR